MRGGLIISVTFHAALLVALVIGLPFFDSAPKQAPPPIPVEIVRLSDATSAPEGAKPQPKTDKTPDADKTTTREPARRDPKAGDKGKETKTAKVEPKPEPEKPQAKPEPKPQPKLEPKKPAPRADAKPEPKPAPKAKPERVEAAPTPRKIEPKPEKKQVAEATPPPAKVEKPKDDDAEPEKKRTRIAARPQVRPKAPPEAAREPEPKQEPEKRTATKKRGDVKSMDSVFKTVNQFKKETRETDKEDQTARPKPVGRETAKKSAPLTISEIDAIRRQIQPCWNFPAGAANPENLRVMIRLQLRPDGSLISAEVRDRSRMTSDTYYRAAAEAALRAVRNPQCSPLKLPAAKYDQWKSLTLEFDPAKLKAG